MVLIPERDNLNDCKDESLGLQHSASIASGRFPYRGDRSEWPVRISASGGSGSEPDVSKPHY